jgi:hypothetical protein
MTSGVADLGPGSACKTREGGADPALIPAPPPSILREGGALETSNMPTGTGVVPRERGRDDEDVAGREGGGGGGRAGCAVPLILANGLCFRVCDLGFWGVGLIMV